MYPDWQFETQPTNHPCSLSLERVSRKPSYSVPPWESIYLFSCSVQYIIMSCARSGSMQSKNSCAISSSVLPMTERICSTLILTLAPSISSASLKASATLFDASHIVPSRSNKTAFLIFTPFGSASVAAALRFMSLENDTTSPAAIQSSFYIVILNLIFDMCAEV